MLFTEVVAAFNAAYTGRDGSLSQRLDWWADHLGDLPIPSITADHIEDAFDALAARGALRYVRGKGMVPAGRPIAPATLNRYRASLGTLFRFAKQRRLTGRGWISPLRDVDAQPEGEGRLTYLTAEQIERVLACSRLAHWKRLPAIILMGFSTGLRLGALQEMRWLDVDLERRRVLTERTKNGRPQVSHLTERMVEELRKLPGGRAPESLVFCGKKDPLKAHNFSKAWERALKDARVEYMPFHALRHSCASHAASRGASLVLLKDLLGHKSLRMVSRYSHLSIDDRAKFVDSVFL